MDLKSFKTLGAGSNLIVLSANIRLGWKRLMGKNIPAHCDMAAITAVSLNYRPLCWKLLMDIIVAVS